MELPFDPNQGSEDKHHPSAMVPYTTLDKIQYIIDVIEKETKRERPLIKYLLYSGWSTYSNDPINLLVNSRSPGQGKTHPILAVLDYFPRTDWIPLTGSSDKALYHEKGRLVRQNPETDEFEDVGPEIVGLEAKIAEIENEIASDDDMDKSVKKQKKSEITEYKKQIQKIKSESSKLISLEHKILVFLDTPNMALLEALMPLLSHDEYYSKYKFVDKKGGSIESTDNILWGWPTIIFSQTLDPSFRKRWPELARRFIVVNPTVSREKVSDSVDLAIDGASLPDELYQDEILEDSEANKARNMVKEIRHEFLEFSRNLRKPDGTYDKKKSAVFNPFKEALKTALPKSGDMNDVTNAKRFLRFQTLSTITQVNKRPVIKVAPKPTEDNADKPASVREIPLVVFADTEIAIDLMRDAANTGLRPEQRIWFNEVFRTTYDTKKSKDFKYDPKSKKKNTDETDWIKLFEDIKAIRVEELVKATKRIRGEIISPRDIREKYLEPLVNNGLVDETDSKIDGRVKIYYPVTALLEEEEEETKDKKLERNDIRSNFLEGDKLHLRDISIFPTEDYIKSKIQGALEKYDERGFTAKLFDGRDTEAPLDDIIQIYYSQYQAERVLVVDNPPSPSYYFQEGENRDDLQTHKEKDEKPRESEAQDYTKLEREENRSNFLQLEKNPMSDVRVETKSSNNRKGAIEGILKRVETLTKEGKPLLSLALKDSCIAFDGEWKPAEAGGKLYQFSVMDVLTEQPIESIRITDPHIAGSYPKLVKAIVTAIKKRQNKNARGEIIDDKEVINEQSIGWYSTGEDSDLAQIDKACKKVGIGSPIAFRDEFPYIAGQEHIDLHHVYNNRLVKSSVFKNKYRALDLGHVGKKIVGLGKYQDLNGLEASSLSVEEQKEYNLRDCLITAKLAKAKDCGLLALMKVISELVVLPFDKTCHTDLPYWWANLFRLEGSTKSINPNTGAPYFWDYEGGLVEDPKTGLKKNIRMLDVASLYPTMSRRYNLSMETVECACCKDDPKAYVSKDVLVSRLGDKPIERNYWVCRRQKGDFAKFLDEFTELRLSLKRDKRPEFKKINKVLSDGLKIVLNGGYGCFGYRHFKYLDVRVAELVTSYGRYTLRQIMKIANKYGLQVIYGDTDSVFVEGENATNDDIIKQFIQDANKALNIELEDDKLFVRCIIHGKKHYIGVYWDDEKKEWDTIVKGLEGAKADRPAFINRIHEKIVDDFEANINPWTAIASELKKLVNKELPPEDFKYEIQLGFDPEHYSENDVKRKVGLLMQAKEEDLIWFYKIHNGDTDRARALEQKDGGAIAYQNPNNISYEKALKDVESTFGPLLQHLGLDPDVLFKEFHEEVPKDKSDPYQETIY